MQRKEAEEVREGDGGGRGSKGREGQAGRGGEGGEEGGGKGGRHCRAAQASSGYRSIENDRAFVDQIETSAPSDPACALALARVRRASRDDTAAAIAGYFRRAMSSPRRASALWMFDRPLNCRRWPRADKVPRRRTVQDRLDGERRQPGQPDDGAAPAPAPAAPRDGDHRASR